MNLLFRVASGAAALLFLAAGPAAEAAVDFARDVHPLLIKRCLECHGPDQQKSNLRLDSREAALKGGKSGKPVLVPGNSAGSELIARLTHTDPDELMPPKGERLTAAEVTGFRAWIDAGAVWPADGTHWAYLPPVRPPEPPVQDKKWSRNTIDRFILARLEKEHLPPQKEAGRATLIRRLSLDLTGLPPTPEEVRLFENDRAANAYERLVDRLLESPHYGEHIGRWWLDLARYADSNGYQVDLARSIWPYRDWVIDAFNRNLPFDQFTIEQLAGDLLPNPSLSQKIATGFNRNSKLNDEGGGDAEEYRDKALVDRVATTATVWLGATMACAQCHTHKYDPITHEDYYRFYAFFNNTADGGNYSIEPTVAVPPPDLSGKLDYLHAEITRWQEKRRTAEARLTAWQTAWEKSIPPASPWSLLRPLEQTSVGGATLTNLADGSLLTTGSNPEYDTFTILLEGELDGASALLLEALPDDSLPKKGPGRWRENGNFILDEFSASFTPDGGGNPVPVEFADAWAEAEQLYYPARYAIDRNAKTGWANGARAGQSNFAVFHLRQPISGRGKLTVRLEQNHGNNHVLGRFRLSSAKIPASTPSDGLPHPLWPVRESIRPILALVPTARTEAQRAELAAYFAAIAPEMRACDDTLRRLNQRETQLAALRFTTPVMQELPAPRDTKIHVRGNFLDKGKSVTPGVPAVWPPLPAGSATNRLALARWLVTAENPLTARVTVNRLWERFFGTGLVKTSEDLGKQGEAPSHPELLDWLATEFVRTGWDMKAMQRLLLHSATYRQESTVTPAALEKDPYNRLLARAPRFRLDAEAIRDQMLAISGLLNPEAGGPPVYPIQPDHMWKEIGFLRPEIGMDVWPTSEGGDLYRRAVYTFWRRIVTYPSFSVFDAPSRDVCTARRPRTNTPLQALTALNDPVAMEAARVFARRILEHGGRSLEAQVDYAFRLCLSRPPTRAESRRLAALFEQQRVSFQTDPAAAKNLTTIGPAAVDTDLPADVLAAWTVLANVLLNLDETLTKG